MNMQEKIWVAADVPTVDQGKDLLGILHSNDIRNIKVGLELLSVEDRDEFLKVAFTFGFNVFWDGKFDDIPNTVGAASRIVASRGVVMFNVHASAGLRAMEAAVANKGNSKVLAVTLLTSIGNEDLPGLGYPVGTSTDVVVRARAITAVKAGVDGIICSAKEAQMVRSVMPQGMIVTPAIRPLWAVAGDQKRPTTPADAIKAGATDLVIGRPITNPPPEIGSPAEALKRIIDEMETALGEASSAL